MCTVRWNYTWLIHIAAVHVQASMRMLVVHTWTFPGRFCPSPESSPSESGWRSPQALLGFRTAQWPLCSVALWTLQCMRQKRLARTTTAGVLQYMHLCWCAFKHVCKQGDLWIPLHSLHKALVAQRCRRFELALKKTWMCHKVHKWHTWWANILYPLSDLNTMWLNLLMEPKLSF